MSYTDALLSENLPRVLFNSILDKVVAYAERSGISRGDILGKGRAQQYLYPRMLVFKLVLDANPNVNVSLFGKMINNNHATVLHWKKSFDNKYHAFQDYLKNYNEFEANTHKGVQYYKRECLALIDENNKLKLKIEEYEKGNKV